MKCSSFFLAITLVVNPGLLHKKKGFYNENTNNFPILKSTRRQKNSFFPYGFFHFFSTGAIPHSHLLLCTKSGNLQTYLVSIPSSTQVTTWLEY